MKWIDAEKYKGRDRTRSPQKEALQENRPGSSACSKFVQFDMADGKYICK